MRNSLFRPLGVPSIRVPHLKNTRDCETTALLEPKQVTLLLSQHIGAPAKLCVEKGQKVYVGTLVGEAQGFVSANVHSSVSGVVAEIREVITPTGARVVGVAVDSDGEFTPDPSIRPPRVSDAETLVAAIAQSGLVGLGGAGFPTHVKLKIPEGANVDTLLINAAECEPYITSDYREMIEFPKRIVNGVRTVSELLGLSRAIIAVEDNKPLAVEILTRFAAYKNIEVVTLKSSYPQGAEKVLITNATGRVVPSGKLPSDAGVLVLNVGTISFISNYLETGMPLVSKRITVDGDAVARSCNMLVPIGTPIKDIIESAGGYLGECARLLMGGPMMGTALYSDEFPLLKNNNAVLALSPWQISLPKENPCIRCGRCGDSCPMSLSPVEIQQAYEVGDIASIGKLGAANCIECGSCTFVCPAKRSITQTMRLCKEALRKAAKKK
ncbi:MAG: electron transport complex subunit RsxC [Oscillospiraceae bacterium]